MDDDYIWGTADYRGMANVVILFVGIYAIFGIIGAICTVYEWAGRRWPSATRWAGLSVGALAAIAYLGLAAIACFAFLAFLVRAYWDYAGYILLLVGLAIAGWGVRKLLREYRISVHPRPEQPPPKRPGGQYAEGRGGRVSVLAHRYKRRYKAALGRS